MESRSGTLKAISAILVGFLLLGLSHDLVTRTDFLDDDRRVLLCESRLSILHSFGGTEKKLEIQTDPAV